LDGSLIRCQTVVKGGTGSRSIDKPVDGLLIFGGYDQARIGGTLTAFGQPLLINVTGISYDYGNKSFPLFSPSEGYIVVCMDTDLDGIKLSQQVVERYSSATGSTFDPDTGSFTLPAGAQPSGSISFALANGYVTTVPVDELWLPERFWNSDGQYTASPKSQLFSQVVNVTVPEATLSFGLAFMTMN
jgi:hypothetical protein